jgi:enoyl-CoA hydratase/carnithine racemase
MKVAPLSARATKQMAMTGLDWPLDVALRLTYSEHQRAMASDDWLEGPRAFSEKRRPNWTGA